jgi:hypothetical protein
MDFIFNGVKIPQDKYFIGQAFNGVNISLGKNLTGQAPVKYATLDFCEIFNGAGRF